MVYVPPLPTNAVELKQRISLALETDTEDMVQRVRDEFGYRLDQGWVTGKAQQAIISCIIFKAGHINFEFLYFALKIRNFTSKIYQPFIVSYSLP